MRTVPAGGRTPHREEPLVAGAPSAGREQNPELASSSTNLTRSHEISGDLMRSHNSDPMHDFVHRFQRQYVGAQEMIRKSSWKIHLKWDGNAEAEDRIDLLLEIQHCKFHKLQLHCHGCDLSLSSVWDRISGTCPFHCVILYQTHVQAHSGSVNQ